MYSETFNSKPTRDSSSSNCGQEHHGSVIYTFASQKALYSLEFRDIHLFETAGVKIMQKDQL